MLRVFNNKRAATLIEVVIAILILACAFFPILRVVDYGSVSTAKIGNYAKATRLAQELIEECKHVPFSLWKKFHVPENPEPNQIIDFDTINEDFYKGYPSGEHPPSDLLHHPHQGGHTRSTPTTGKRRCAV